MSIIITAIGPNPHPPYGIRIELECEAATDIFYRGIDKFEHPNGYIGCHALAMSAGWMERQTPQGRSWICPRCSNKQEKK
jgi:hypothetical protein